MGGGSESSSISVESEQQMKVFLKVIKTLALNVKRSDCVSDLKASICVKEGISQFSQELIFSGKRLNDEQKLIDCGIQENSTLNVFVQNLVVIKLLVTIVSKQTTVEIEAKSKETIETIKRRVCSKEGLDLTHHYSFYNAGTLLDDLQTLASLGIHSESTLHMVFNARDVLSISIKLPDGKTMKTKAKMCFYVAEFKAFVGSIAGFSVVGHSIYFGGEELDEKKTLACFDLKEDSTLKIGPSKIVVIVREPVDSDFIFISIDPGENVAALRTEVTRLTRCQTYSLMFCNKRLEDDKDLAFYGIKDNSSLSMKTGL